MIDGTIFTSILVLFQKIENALIFSVFLIGTQLIGLNKLNLSLIYLKWKVYRTNHVISCPIGGARNK